MRVRSVISRSALICAVAAASIAPLAAQARKQWTPALTPDGQPDLRGNWVNKSATPLERPPQLADRESLTDSEVAELKKRADRIFKQTDSDFPAGDDVYLAALTDLKQYKRASATGSSENLLEREFDNRTALIVDPPDGRIPPYTRKGLLRRNAGIAAANPESDADGPEALTGLLRCLTAGVPMPRPGNYTSYYQIVQAPGYVMIQLEAIHDARIIPLDGRPHLPASVRTWNGDSRGRWEGKTLVVDTTNFSPKNNFMGAAENLHLVERFSRVAADELRYEMTVDDPSTWTKPWTAVLRLKHTPDNIYELACHEGNLRVVESMLLGTR